MSKKGIGQIVLVAGLCAIIFKGPLLLSAILILGGVYLVNAR